MRPGASIARSSHRAPRPRGLAAALIGFAAMAASATWWLGNPTDLPPPRDDRAMPAVADATAPPAVGAFAAPLVETAQPTSSDGAPRSAGASVAALRICGSDLTYELVGRCMIERGAAAGHPAVWESAPAAIALHRLREGRCDIALLEERPKCRQPGLETDDLASCVADECVLAVLASPGTVERMTTAEARRILNGTVDTWRRIGGPDLAVDWRGIGDRPVSLLDSLFRLRGRARAMPPGDHSDAAVVAAVRANRGAFGIADLASLQPADLAPGTGRLAVAIDNIACSRDEYRNGRYPFGLTTRAVWQRGSVAEAFLRDATPP